MKSHNEILLNINPALVGNIGSNFRMICADWDEKSFTLYIYTEDDPKNHDYDLSSIILTEFENNIQFDKYEEKIEKSKLPLNLLKSYKLILFARDES